MWDDSRGVLRTKEDPAYNGTGQAITCLYNNSFAKYTPGLANFERGCAAWDAANEYHIYTEAGGTGTLRRLSLDDAGLDVHTGDVAQQFTLQKITATAATPGAGLAGLHVRAGTNAGTCKVTVNAGTSATEITIVDNVGSGC